MKKAMSSPVPDSYKEIAESMGISLYQRFSMNEASLFLRCQVSDLAHLIADGRLSFIRISDTNSEFFGYQLLEHLLENVTDKDTPTVNSKNLPERIIRAGEVTQLTGLSRTTLWRMEKTGQFPARVSLGVGSVGWRFTEVSRWIKERKGIYQRN